MCLQRLTLKSANYSCYEGMGECKIAFAYALRDRRWRKGGLCFDLDFHNVTYFSTGGFVALIIRDLGLRRNSRLLEIDWRCCQMLCKRNYPMTTTN